MPTSLIENRKLFLSLSKKYCTWIEQIVFGSGLVFNQTWEDPAIDRQALDIHQEDVVVSIASAGDNVLALALDAPKQIIAVDLNPAQIFLLQLKIVAIQQLEYEDFWHLFSLNRAPRARELYGKALRLHLQLEAQNFWDKHISLIESGLGHSGIFGRTLLLLRHYLRLVSGRRTLEQFFNAASIEDQAALYCTRVHSRWWTLFARTLVSFHPTLLLFGAHPYQTQRVQRQPFADILSTSILRALTSLPARENFFWQQVFLGRYLRPPDFARPESFYRLKNASHTITTCIGRLENILASLPAGSAKCFNLMDAPDWLSPEQTIHLWKLMERAASSGAKVLFRTIDPLYQLPAPVLTAWKDKSVPIWTAEERTGVYARVFLYELTRPEIK